MSDPQIDRSTPRGERRRPGGRAASLLLGLVAALASCAPPPAENLVLVVLDTVRADRMSIYGHPEPTTPYLESLAPELLRYAEVRAPAPWTIPTHATMLTGLVPAEHRAQWGSMTLHERFETLPERLTAEGFFTTGLSANLLVAASNGLTQGFESFELVRGPWPEKTGTILAKVPPLLDRARDERRRLFLFLNLMDAHIPYNTQRYGERFGVEGPGPIKNARVKWEISAGVRELPPDEAEQHRAAYSAAIRYLDDVIRDLLALLAERGILDDTLVVVTSDHGDGLGFHPEVGHSISLWEEQLSVPLLVRFPAARRGGEVVGGRTSTAALFPSLLDWLGLERPAWLEERPGLDAATASDAVADYRSYFSEANRSTNRDMAERYPQLAATVRHGHAVYCGDRKLIAWQDGRRLFFDLRSDPNEQRDLAGAPAEQEALRRCLQRYRRALEDGRLTPFDAASPEEGQPPDLETLRALGYVQ